MPWPKRSCKSRNSRVGARLDGMVSVADGSTTIIGSQLHAWQPTGHKKMSPTRESIMRSAKSMMATGIDAMTEPTPAVSLPERSRDLRRVLRSGGCAVAVSPAPVGAAHGAVGSDLRCGRRAGGVAARARVARGARWLCRSGGLYHGFLSGQRRGQAAAGGSAFGAGAARRRRRRGARPGLRRGQAGAGRPADRRGQLRGVPGRGAPRRRPARGRAAPGARLLLEEHRRHAASPHAARRQPAAVDLRRRPQWPRRAARQAGSRALPARRRGLGDPAGAVPGGRGRAGRHRRPRAPPAWPRSGSPASATRPSCAPPAPTSS